VDSLLLAVDHCNAALGWHAVAERRVFLIVLDSLGVGALPDAADYGDAGAHTLDHLVSAAGGLDAPRLIELGLGHVPGVASLPRSARPVACFGRAAMRAPAKDTTSGHWEMMGLVRDRPCASFPRAFSPEVVQELVQAAGLPGLLGNEVASGSEIVARLGAEHVATGKPILYTSADSVMQIAAHEVRFGLERLYVVCRVARAIADRLDIARVIARPFVGGGGAFVRTYNRRDFSLPPSGPTVLDGLVATRLPVVGVGKIGDLFSGRGLTRTIHAEGNADAMRATLACARSQARGLIFVNLIDFDMLYGHRRDPPGYRRSIEAFDRDLRELERELRADDVMVLSADHGNDPTFTATTDHTREYVPILAFGPRVARGVALGTRASLADIGATVAELFGVGAPSAALVGRSFARELGAVA
jgi:phosphopentomutase